MPAARVLAATPDSPGSLGIAISEAVEDAATHADTNYALGSVLNHVMLHQTVIGQEAKLQMEQAGEDPEVVIGCFGGGSNFGGLALPYVLGPAGRQRSAHRRRGAVRLSQPHQGNLRVRLWRHRETDAADQDVHAGPRFRSARNSRRRIALPRRVAAAQPSAQTRADRGQIVPPVAGIRGGAFSSRVPRAFCRRRNRRTPSAPPWTKRCWRVKRVGSAPSCSASAATATSISASYESYLTGKLQDYEYPGQDVARALAEI